MRSTHSGGRLRRRHSRAGSLSWLLLPGGPGLGSESLHELADALDVPGTIWMVDLPGDGSNSSRLADPYALWPRVLVEAAEAVPNAVFVGHSTGGMYLLSTPELEAHVVGLALVSSAPDASWRAPFFAMTERNPLPAVTAAAERYETERTSERLRDVAVASAEWNFMPSHVDVGRELLRRLPYNPAAEEWSGRCFDDTYVHAWWPQQIPTLILSGADDRIVSQAAWDRPAHCGEHVLRRTLPGAAHFPWIEQPDAVRAAFRELASRITAKLATPNDFIGREKST